jgi:hypothetical protein
MHFPRGVRLCPVSETQVGVIYVAFGAPYLAMSLVSIASLRVFNPFAPVCVVTNVRRNPQSTSLWNLDEDLLHWIYLEDPNDKNRNAKLDIYHYSPFSKTLYLDCDTFVLSDISDMSFFLDHFDVSLRHILRPVIDSNKKLFNGTMRLGDAGAFNGGVIGFRKGENVERFFNCWGERFKALGFRQDQPSLVEAVFDSDIRLLPLPEKWNMGDTWLRKRQSRDDVIIWHYKTRLDQYIESYLLSSTKFFSDDPKDLTSVVEFIQDRRRMRGYGGLKWMVKTLVNEVRGPLAKIPGQHAGSESWNRLFAGSRIRDR